MPSSNEPSTNNYLQHHPLYKIASYDINNLPTLQAQQNYYQNPSNHLLLSPSNHVSQEKGARNGVLFQVPSHSTIPINPVGRIYESTPSSSLPTKPKTRHLFIPATDDIEIEPIMNVISNQRNMVVDLSRFKVYKAVPDDLF